MNSQCKRPLEHSVSSQPVKYLRQSALEQQASTGDVAPIFSIQAPVVINSLRPIACDVLHLDIPDLPSARESTSGTPATTANTESTSPFHCDGEVGGKVGCKETWHNDSKVHIDHGALQDGVGCQMATHESSANLQNEDSCLDRALDVSTQQISCSSTGIACVEPSLAAESVPKQVMERPLDGRQIETRAGEFGIVQDVNTIEDKTEVNRANWHPGTEIDCVDSTATCTQTIRKTLEAWLLKGGKPLLVRMGEKEVNLPALNTWVRLLGGYKKVTDSGLWGTIADHLGLGRDCGPGVKLVYAKCLTTHDTVTALDLQALVTDAGKPNPPRILEFKFQVERKDTCDEEMSSEDFVGWQIPSRGEVNQAGLNHITQTPTQNDWEGGQSAKAMPLHEKSLDMMVGWIKEMAVDLDSSQYHQSGGISCQEQSFQSLAGRVRSVLWLRRQELQTADGFLIQARQLPPPSVYYEDPVQPKPQAKEKLQATRERLAHYGSQSPFSDHQPRTKRVPIGPNFQAHVLLWRSQDITRYSGESGHTKSGGDDDTQSSDEESYDSTKWLGSKMWPLSESKRVVNKSRDGRGRQPSCFCPVPGSQECVRLHIEAERQKLFGEIGQTFELWGFDQMGECVATQWTKKEERTFKAIVRLNPPSHNKNFWDELPTVFPDRSHSELVSYYFNVFVLRRRALQNRVSGAKIDSDDDETELVDSESDEDSSDDSDHEDHGSGGFRDPYEVHPDRMKVTYLQNSSRQENLFLHTKGPAGNSLHFQSLGDDDNEDADTQKRYRQQSDEKAFHLDVEWKGKHCATEEGSTSQGKVSLPWEHPQWSNATYPSVQGADSVTHIQSALTDGHAVTQTDPNYAEIWEEPVIEIAPTFERDKLLSTEGMIAELFGDE